MDEDQKELQSLGFFDIWSEAFDAFVSSSTTFLFFHLILTVPLSFIYFGSVDFSKFFGIIVFNQYMIVRTVKGEIIAYISSSNSSPGEWMKHSYVSFQVALVILFLIFSLWTLVVIYTTAIANTHMQVMSTTVVRAISRAWKRLVVTFLCVFPLMFVYHFAFTCIFIVTYEQIAIGRHILVFVELALYLVGLCCMGGIWQLAYVVLVMEESCGIQALRRSNELLKGKMEISLAFYLVFNLCFGWVQVFLEKYTAIDASIGVFRKLGLCGLSLALVFLLLLFQLVLQTVIYFVCKSQQNLDNFILFEHSEVYGDDYVSLKDGTDTMVDHV